VRLLALPAPGALVPASERASTLRGLGAGGGENNLGFRCMRKRLLFETVHLDAEGGVGERRTAPSATSVADAEVARAATAALVPVQVGGADAAAEPEPEPAQAKKAKKRVAFRPERAELYEF
jgi:elongator complex protein 4